MPINSSRRAMFMVVQVAFAILAGGATRESIGTQIRYTDPMTTRLFDVTPTNGMPDLLKFLAAKGQIRMLPGLDDPGSTSAAIDTKYLAQVGSPLPVTPSRLASFGGFTTFAWVQNIISEPGSRAEFKDGKRTPAPAPILDPILNYDESSHYYELTSSTEKKVPLHYSPFAFGDAHEPYWNDTWVVIKTKEPPLSPGAYLDFYDRPRRPAGWFKAGESLQFRTELVGVDDNYDVAWVWNGIGTNFTWRTNAVSAAIDGTDSVSPDDYLPPIIDGGVFDVQQDIAVPEPASVLLALLGGLGLVAVPISRRTV